MTGLARYDSRLGLNPNSGRIVDNPEVTLPSILPMHNRMGSLNRTVNPVFPKIPPST